MAINVLLGGAFFGSFFLLWYRISQKIPEIVAIHDEVITQRLHEDSARFRIFLLHVKTFYKEEYYQTIFWNCLGKVFYRVHIIVLRCDNYLIGLLKKIRTHGGLTGLSVSEQEMHERLTAKVQGGERRRARDYWSVLKDAPSAQTTHHAHAHAHARIPRKQPIEGVRVRARKVAVKAELRG